MQDTPIVTIGEALETYRDARNESDSYLTRLLNITDDDLAALKTQSFPRPRRAELGEVWITPKSFHMALDDIAYRAGIQGIYRDRFTSMLLWYCYQDMDNNRAIITYWLEKLENSYKPNTSFNNQMADIAIQIMREMRNHLS